MSTETKILNELNLRKYLKLVVEGYCETTSGRFILRCPEHGNVLGYRHGYHDSISCPECLREWINTKEAVAV